MKVADARVCIDCDEIFEPVTATHCPCGSKQTVALRSYFKPLKLHSASEEVKIGHFEYQDDQFPKQCSCGLLLNLADWLELKGGGVMTGKYPDGERFAADIEMRICYCGTSMGVKLK